MSNMYIRKGEIYSFYNDIDNWAGDYGYGVKGAYRRDETKQKCLKSVIESGLDYYLDIPFKWTFDANSFQIYDNYKQKIQIIFDGFYWNLGPNGEYIKMTSEDYFIARLRSNPDLKTLYSKTNTNNGDITFYDGSAFTEDERTYHFYNIREDNSLELMDSKTVSSFPKNSDGYITPAFTFNWGIEDEITDLAVETPVFDACKLENLGYLSGHGLEWAIRHDSPALQSYWNNGNEDVPVKVVTTIGFRHFHSFDDGQTWVEDLHFPECYDETKGGLLSGNPNAPHDFNEWWVGSDTTCPNEVKELVYAEDIERGFYGGYTSGGMVRSGGTQIFSEGAKSSAAGITEIKNERVNTANHTIDYDVSLYGYEEINYSPVVPDTSPEFDPLRNCHKGSHYILLPQGFEINEDSVSLKESVCHIENITRFANYKNTGCTLFKIDVYQPIRFQVTNGEGEARLGSTVNFTMSIPWVELMYRRNLAANRVSSVYTAYLDDNGNERLMLGSSYYAKSDLAVDESLWNSLPFDELNSNFFSVKDTDVVKETYSVGYRTTSFSSESDTSLPSEDPAIKTITIPVKDYPLWVGVRLNSHRKIGDYFTVINGDYDGAPEDAKNSPDCIYHYDGTSENTYTYTDCKFLIDNLNPEGKLTLIYHTSSTYRGGFYAEFRCIDPEKFIFYDYNNTGEIEEKSSLYAFKTFNITLTGTAVSGFFTTVASDTDPEFKPINRTTLSTDDEDAIYSYRLAVSKASSNTINRVILYDILESAVPNGKSGWKGMFDSVDTSYAESKGIAPVVYYSTVRNLSYPVYDSLTQEDTWYQDTSVWSTTMPEDKSTITAVAIDLSKKGNGSIYDIPDNGVLYAIINMKAPKTDPRIADPDAEFAYNQAAYSSFSNIKGGSNLYSLLSGSPIRVGLNSTDVTVSKVWDNESDWWEDEPASVQIQLLADGSPATGTTPQILNESNGWSYTFNSLPVFNDLGSEVVYTVSETPVNAGELDNYTKTESHGMITDIDPDTGDEVEVENPYDIIVTNTHNNDPNDIYFGKFDTDDRTESNPLSGAAFNLEYWNPGSDIISTADATSTYTSASYDLQSLSDGYYKLTEQTPVPNYGIVPPISFTVKNGVITLNEPARTDAVTSTYDSKVMLSIFDTPLAELSSTGGNGIGNFTVFGLAAIITGNIILYCTKKKQKYQI